MATPSDNSFERSVADPVRGHAPIMQSLNVTIREIAKTDLSVLLVGESGTGKEVYARLIHRLSGLGETPLKKVRCAALDAGQLLAEVRSEFLPASESREVSPLTVFL